MVATSILAKVDNGRLQRGVEGLTAGAYRITLTRQAEAGICAYVTNGDGKTYSITLTEGKPSVAVVTVCFVARLANTL